MKSAPIRPLGDLVECLDRQRVPVRGSERVTGVVPYFGANGQQGWIDRPIFNEPLVLVAEDGGHFDQPHRGVAYKIDGPSWVNNHAHVLRPRDVVDLHFLYQVLRNYDFTRYITGSTRSKLTQAQLLKAAIPVPALEEQRRIAAILDQADAIRTKRRLVVKQVSELPGRMFEAQFGESVQQASLNEVTVKITDGTHQSPEWAPHGVPFIFISNIAKGEIDLRTSKYVSEDTWRKLTRRTPVEVGDLLYSTVGSYGVPALVVNDAPFAFQRHIAHLKFSDAVLPEFMHAQMASPFVFRQARRAARGVAQPTVNLGDIRKFSVKVPPIDDQRDFVRGVREIRKVREMVEGALMFDDELFASLQTRAFGGEL